MTEQETTPTTPSLAARTGSLWSYLAGIGRGRWATSRGRKVQVCLTAALILTGISAWALALVQPWTSRASDRGVVAAAQPLDPGVVRKMSQNAAGFVWPAAREPSIVGRNPFAAKGDVQGSAPAQAATDLPRQTPTDQPSQVPAAGMAFSLTPEQVLETVKGLKLEVTLTSPGNQRWAVINGSNFREGEVVAGLELVEIQEGRAKLQHGGITCLLRMD